MIRSNQQNIVSEATASSEFIHNRFEARARLNPDAVAVIAGDDRVTYQQLNIRANRLAHYLRSLGVSPKVRIGIGLERSVDMFVCILGVLKAGATYVAIDPSYPSERIRYMLRDSDVTILLTEEKLVKDFQEYQGTIIRLGSDATKIDQHSYDDPITSAVETDPAYIIYTSGSTGTPKGVMVTHANLVNYVRTLPDAIGLNSSDRYLHTASFSFSSSVRQAMLPLAIGATIVVAGFEQTRDPLALLELVREEDVTVIDLVPSFWRSCLLSIKSTSKQNRRRLLSNRLRLLLSASEPLPVSLAVELTSLFGQGISLVNMYGQTETSGIIAVQPIDPAGLSRTGIVPIGRGITNAKTYVVDPQMRLVRNGDSGELLVGGKGVGQGYVNRPKLTADRFIRDPFGEGTATEILYRTGDLVRYGPAGELEYIGRIDNQVKVRGFRVELGEIEAVIGQFHGVTDVVVAAREEKAGDTRLAAYVVGGKEAKIDITELTKYLRSRLPDYMVPSDIVELERLPRTPNGKVDRNGLPEAGLSRPTARLDYVPPKTETERVLTEIWSDVLRIDTIGIQDRFFDLGGDSLLAIRMFASIEQKFRKNVPIATLFGAGTIEKLAEILDQDEWAPPESCIVPIQSDGTQPPFFCVHAGGGNVIFYHELAGYLPEDRPFYGIRARRLGGRQVGHATIEEMAEHYIKEIRTVQPDGPYFLGGVSLGGMIGFEMARQLRSQGQDVSLLAMVDTWGPGYPRLLPNVSKTQWKIYALTHRARKHLDHLRTLTLSQKAQYFLNIVIKLRKRLKRNLTHKYKKVVRVAFAQFEQPIPKEYIQIEDTIRKAGRKYKPEKYEGRIMFFRAEHQPAGIVPDRFLGWEPFAVGGMEIHDVPGDHITLMKEPNIRIVAEKLTECLRLNQMEERETYRLPITEKRPTVQQGQTI
jgi:amino acid adenylation domain-containing protein